MKIKITKEKLNTFFTYETVKMVAVCVALCFAIFLVFNAFTTRPSYGQEIVILYERDLVAGKDVDKVLSSLTTKPENDEEKTTFSYEVLRVSKTELNESDYNIEYMLKRVYTELYEDDIMFLTEDVYKSYISEGFATDIIVYLEDAISFFKEKGLCNQEGVFSKSAVDSYFYQTRGKDKRFKTAQQKEQGANYEYERVTSIYKYAKALLNVFELHPELLTETTFDYYGQTFTGKYAIELSSLVGNGENKPENLFSRAVMNETEIEYTAQGVYLVLGENKEQTGDLYYESVTFLYEIVNRYTPYLN